MEWRYDHLEFHEQRRTPSNELYAEAQAYLNRLEAPKSRRTTTPPMRDLYTPEPFVKSSTFLSEMESSGLFSDMEDTRTSGLSWQSFYTTWTEQQQKQQRQCFSNEPATSSSSTSWNFQDEEASHTTSSYASSIEDAMQSAMVDLEEAKQVVHNVTGMVMGCMQNIQCLKSAARNRQRLPTTTMTTDENEIQQRWRQQMNDIARIKELQQRGLEKNPEEQWYETHQSKTMLKRTRAYDFHRR